METDASTKGSVMQQKSSLPSPNHLPELSSESEWEAMSQLPGLYLFYVYLLYIDKIVSNACMVNIIILL